jgi:hypothetical protein
MTEAEWLACVGSDDWRLFLHDKMACLHGRCSVRQLRLFALACCRHINPRFPDPRSAYALGIAERYVDGRASEEEYEAAYRESKKVNAEFQAILDEVVFSKRCSKLVWWTSYVAYYAQTLGDEEAERHWQAQILCDIVGEHEPLPEFDCRWRTGATRALAEQMYESPDFVAMPILADLLQDAGCGDELILGHCRGPGPHARGCWVVDLVLGKE